MPLPPIPPSAPVIITTALNSSAYLSLDTSTTSGHTTNTYINTTANFVVGDLCTFVGGTFTTAAVMQVSSVDGNGKITGVVVNTPGAVSYTHLTLPTTERV